MKKRDIKNSKMRKLLAAELESVAGGGPHLSHTSHMSHQNHMSGTGETECLIPMV